jgi:hypothetical protein
VRYLIENVVDNFTDYGGGNKTISLYFFLYNTSMGDGFSNEMINWDGPQMKHSDRLMTVVFY